MSSREIADLTGKEHQHVKRDIRTMMEALKLDASNFGCIYLDSLNREQLEYKLDQDLTMTLITGYSVELRHKINIRWRELETSNKQAIPQTYAAALLEAGRLALEVEKQAEQLAIAAPKVEFVDKYVESENGSMTFRAVCKVLGIKENEFRKFLSDQKIMYRLGGDWTPYQQHLDAGRFEVKA